MMRWVYYRFIYRHLMKLAHRYGWHRCRVIHPEGDTMHVCDWCGLRWVEKRAIRNLLTPLDQKAQEERGLRATSTGVRQK